jgi:hypothetical protein
VDIEHLEIQGEKVKERRTYTISKWVFCQSSWSIFASECRGKEAGRGNADSKSEIGQ